MSSKGHSYNSVVTAPTCNERGYTTHTCSDCGYSYVDSPVESNGHSYTTQQFEPSCTDQGYILHTCTECGHNYKDTYVSEYGHKYDSVVTAPTCTKRGYTTHTCENCGDAYVDSYVKANGHTAGKDATCTEDQTCTVCGEVLTGKLGHSYNSVVTAPTCTAQGYTTHTCSRCGDSYVDSYVSANGHTPGKEATCVTDQTCEVCGTILKGALGHFYETSVATPTCTEEGYLLHVCMDCGHNYTDNYVPANGHTAGDDATCTTDQTCTACGEVLVERLGHNHISVVTAPTCTAQGYTTHTCDRCGDSYVDSYVSANGHTAGDEATCTTAQTCTVCGEVLKGKLGHHYEFSVMPPNCTEQGYTIYTCIDCGHTYNDNYVRPYGHEYVHTVISPKCEEEGYTDHTCSFCGDSYDDAYVPAKGHNYKDVVTEPKCEEEGYTTHTCIDCGDSYDDTYVPAKGHNYEDIVTDPKCEEEGYTTHTCTDCGHSYDDTGVPAKGHGDGVWVTIEGESEDGNPLEGLCCGDCGEIVGVRELVPYLLGDVDFNKEINKKDFALLKRFCIGTAECNYIQTYVSDVNLDEDTDKKDYALIKRYCIGLYEITPNMWMFPFP